MTVSPRPSRLSVRFLRVLMPDAAAEAVLGDLHEDLMHAASGGSGPRWPRLWLERQAWIAVAGAAWSALWRLGRFWRFVGRDAWRSLRSAPGPTSFIVFVLTLGIAAATVTFSVVDPVVLRPLPFEDQDRLVVVTSDTPQGRSMIVAAHEFLAIRSGMTALAGLAAVRPSVWSLQVGGDVDHLPAAQVTASLFDVLDARPHLGQTFTAAHEVAGNDQVAVISHRLWQRRFGGDPDVVGQVLRNVSGADAIPSVILGVMPEDFTYPIGREQPVEIWTPYVIPDDERSSEALNAGSRYLLTVGRLQVGATLDQAQAQVEAVTRALAEARPDNTYRARRPRVTTLYDSLVSDVRGWMLLILWAVGLVLVLACVNVANLLLTRSTLRARELAVRASLGATRRQLVTTLVSESLLLALAAAAGGLLLALWGVGVAKAALPAGIARAAGIALDLRVLGFAIGAAAATGLLFGAVPAWQASRANLVTLLRQSAPTMTVGRRRWRTAFLVSEVAFVGVLLVVTTLFVTSFVRVTRADLGFVRSNLLVVGQVQGFGGTLSDVIDGLRAVPGVQSVGAVGAGSPPLVAAGFGGGSARTSFAVPGAPSGTPPVSAEFRRVSADYFSTAGVPFVAGRTFTRDEMSGVDAIVVDETAAIRLFGEGDAVGQTVWAHGFSRNVTVVGVVRNVRLDGPEQSSGPQVYSPTTSRGASAGFLVRTSRAPPLVIPALQSALAELTPAGRTPPQVLVVEEAFRNITADRRFNASLMSTFGALALFIGAAGVYSVMASVVAQQTHEMGVRVALGATGQQVMAGVLRQAGRHLMVGLVIGLGAAWWASKVFASLLFEVRPTDLFVYVVVAAVLLAVGLVAALVPARRAARVDPLVTLRAE